MRRRLRKRVSPMRATCFGGCGRTVSDENEVCDSCNAGPE